MKKILLTGGHGGSTGLAIIQELKKKSDQYELYWVGVKNALTGTPSESLEHKLYSGNDVKFYSIDAGKVQTKFTKHTISLLLKIPLSFLTAYNIVKKVKPDVILSFGGSISLPVVFAGNWLKIPTIIHEQTAVAGRANQYASRFSNLVAISRESSRKYFNSPKIVLTGNPIIAEIENYLKKRARVNVTTILFTGGSRGSERLNRAIIPILPVLLKKYKVIVQSGEANVSQFTLAHPNLTVFGLETPSQMLKMMAEADIVISRAGANTVSTLIALKKPCLLIPIPWAYLNEQYENAKYIEGLGIARILNQDGLNPERLLAEIRRLIREYPNLIKKTEKISSPDMNASRHVVNLLSKYI